MIQARDRNLSGSCQTHKICGGDETRNEKVMEVQGGFGVVHKQIQETTGHYRAVKTIDKRLPHKLNYSGELLVTSYWQRFVSHSRELGRKDIG